MDGSKRMKVKANPYVITFHAEADGGPEHVLQLLVGYGVMIKKNGRVVCEGTVDLVDENLLYIAKFCEGCGRVNSDRLEQLDMTKDFDEVVYL